MAARPFLIGFPVIAGLVAIGLWLMSRGANIAGALVMIMGVIVLMMLMGQAMPRPDVQARPGEEDDYDD